MIGENTLSFKDNFTKFVNISIAGLAPKEFAPFLMSAPLVPIIKKIVRYAQLQLVRFLDG